MHILDELKERGIIAQMTFEEDLYKAMEKESMTFYVGIDPTADSLHIGHIVPVIFARRLQQAGHRPIILCGGGTAMVGDPSGKSELRQMMTKETISANIETIKMQISPLLDFSEGKAIMENNADWLLQLNYVDFLRDIGVYFSVNRMLTAECYKRRLEVGLTFLEFNYMLMQGYDFLELFRRHNCRIQIGGDDQWSNILAGADLIRRKEHEDAYALTNKLIMTASGQKMGKTEKGALWLDPKRTTPYEFYQYWRNVPDADVEMYLRLLTFVPMDEVRRLGALKDSEINEAKKVLAFEMTKLIHGEEEANKAIDASKALFGGQGSMDNVPTYEVDPAKLAEDGRVTTWLAECGLCKSRGEARKMVEAGAVTVNDEKITDLDAIITPEQFAQDGLMLRKGKKSYCRLVLNTFDPSKVDVGKVIPI
ncbi:MAG TPA: tyrosine--tRNA ligase [Candidatus Limiplasma sp.]|nr:tyrosine--tRNA ligase [Candidatus Limiplasma sp.]HRX09193.1 tyrosine--tRNA ligase [Candidatus Limiplasma sp.]